VAFVTINRAKESHADICDVVFKDKQFSWANHALDNHGKLLPKYMPHGVEWQTARTIARNTISNIHLDFTGGATYYYADYIAKPSWAKNMIQTAHYGHHIFYREVR
jgi:spore germination cell wall hydrolase CwlJ-like protein